MPREKFVCTRQSYGHNPAFIQGKLAAGQTWYKAKITHFGGDHFAIEYNFGETLIMHNHDPHGLLRIIEKYGQKGAKYEPKHRLMSFGAYDEDTFLYSFSPTALVPCYDLENLFW